MNEKHIKNRFTAGVWFDLHSIDYFYSGCFCFFAAGPGAHARLHCAVSGVIVFMETWYACEALLAGFAFYVEGLVQVQSWVFHVDVSLHLCVGGHGHTARRTHIMARSLIGQVSHTLRVYSFHFLFALF